MNAFRFVLALSLSIPHCVSGQQSADKPIDFAHQIAPILKRHCVTCHGGRESEGDLSINTRQSIIDSGVVDTDGSSLLRLISSDDPDEQMPPSDRPRLSQEELQMLTRWVTQGLPWDDGFSFAHSSYEPPLLPRRPQLPPPRANRPNPIDRILDQYLIDHKLDIPQTVDDATFMRRVYLDLIGLLPTADRQREFLADTSVDRRERLVDELLSGNIAYADHWLTFFNDLLRNDYSGTGFITGGRKQVSKWLYESLLANKPFDQFTRELISPPTEESRGYIDGIKWRGEVSAGQTIEIQFSQSIAQSFLGINMKCASCHDSFIDRWTLKEAYGLAAIYASAPLALHRCDKPTGETQAAQWLFPSLGQVDPDAPREQRLDQLAHLMTHSNNGRFARTIVNRLWYRLMGRGIVHPLDAMQSQPWSEDLLDYLAVRFVDDDYDIKAVLRLIATSAAYQSSTEVVAAKSEEGEYLYQGPRPRRMTAEQLLDAVWQLTGSAPESFQAPIIRAQVDDELLESVRLGANWIWAASSQTPIPAGEQILLRKRVRLDSAVTRGGVFITCDNEYHLYINRKLVRSSNDWTKPQTVVIGNLLKSGDNEIVVIAKNAGITPNAAGLYFDARLTLADGQQVSIWSDESWEAHPSAPKTAGSRITAPKDGWAEAKSMPRLSPWTEMINRDAKLAIAALSSNKEPQMVRASLMKNTALMRSLGRPGREQIVSMRPTEFTTLEAIDLANEPQLSQSFARGASRWLSRSWESTDELIETLFVAALTRKPSAKEREIFAEALGTQASAESIQDAMWAICMLPEFLLIR